jgi:hypothetical protein
VRRLLLGADGSALRDRHHEPRRDGVIAALIAAEKLLPRHRTVTYGTAVIPARLGVLVVVAPHAIPGLTVPGVLQRCDPITHRPLSEPAEELPQIVD